MQPIDLRAFADHSVRIPSTFLNKVAAPAVIPTWKILGAHMLDLWVAFSVTMITCGQFSQFQNAVIHSRILQKSMALSATMPLAIFMIVLWSNFFFSYFLNHGQTLGLFAIKKRILMKEQSLGEAMRWSVLSTLTCLTGGISNIYIRVNDKYGGHDHLYRELMRVKEVQAVNLLDHTSSEEEIEKFYQRAA